MEIICWFCVYIRGDDEDVYVSFWWWWFVSGRFVVVFSEVILDNIIGIFILLIILLWLEKFINKKNNCFLVWFDLV